MASDVYGAQDLRRRSTEVLKKAIETPVIVVSPYGTVNVVERGLFQRAEQAGERERIVEDLLRAIAASRMNQSASAYPANLRWVRHLDADDLTTFLSEVIASLDDFADGRLAWSDVEAVLHEWKESATVARDPELRTILKKLSART